MPLKRKAKNIKAVVSKARRTEDKDTKNFGNLSVFNADILNIIFVMIIVYKQESTAMESTFYNLSLVNKSFRKVATDPKFWKQIPIFKSWTVTENTITADIQALCDSDYDFIMRLNAEESKSFIEFNKFSAKITDDPTDIVAFGKDSRNPKIVLFAEDNVKVMIIILSMSPSKIHINNDRVVFSKFVALGKGCDSTTITLKPNHLFTLQRKKNLYDVKKNHDLFESDYSNNRIKQKYADNATDGFEIPRESINTLLEQMKSHRSLDLDIIGTETIFELDNDRMTIICSGEDEETRKAVRRKHLYLCKYVKFTLAFAKSMGKDSKIFWRIDNDDVLVLKIVGNGYQFTSLFANCDQ